MKTLLLLVLALAALQSEAAIRYVNIPCTNNGDGTAPTCAASGGAPGAYNVLSSVTPAIGDTVYLIGTSQVAWNPGGIVGTFAGSYFNLRCDHSSGGGGFRVTSGTTMAFGGGSRNGLEVGPGCSFSGGGTGTNGISIGASGAGINNAGVKIHDNTFTDYTSAGVAIAPVQDASNSYIYVYRNTFERIGSATPLGEGVRIDPARNASGTASGLVQYVDIYENTFINTNSIGRYGVSAYPCSACSLAERATSGRVRNLRIWGNKFNGNFNYQAINLTNDVDDWEVWGNYFNGTFGGAVIHAGGQGTYGTCNASTDRGVIRDHRTGSGTPVSGSVANAFNLVDGAGIYPDECSTNILVTRNEMTKNVFGFYINDADNITLQDNVIWGNYDNEVHIHGAGINFVAYGNTVFSNPTSPRNVAEQGLDGWQMDGTLGAGNVMRNNNIVCGAAAAKCVDLDAPATVTESYNNFYTIGSVGVEGFTPDATDKAVDPLFVGSMSPTEVRHLCLLSTSTLIDAGLYISPAVNFDKPPLIGAGNKYCTTRIPVTVVRAAAAR